MTKKQFYILLSILLVAILIFSNPSEENHIETVKSKLKIAFKKKMASEMIEDESNSMKSLGKGLGLLFGDAVIDKMTDGFISRDNYFVFSITKADYKGENKIIGLGLLGNVFISNKIEEVFNKKEDIESNPELEYLKKYKDQYPSDVKLLESGLLKTRLESLLSKDNLEKFINYTSVETPIQVNQDIFFLSGGLAHSFGTYESALCVNLKTSKITVGILDEDKVLIFSEDSENPNNFEKIFYKWYLNANENANIKL